MIAVADKYRRIQPVILDGPIRPFPSSETPISVLPFTVRFLTTLPLPTSPLPIHAFCSIFPPLSFLLLMPLPPKTSSRIRESAVTSPVGPGKTRQLNDIFVLETAKSLGATIRSS